MKAEVFRDLLKELNNGNTAELEISAQGAAYTRKFAPVDRLILLGCGHVSQAVSRMAALLDFTITAVDDRPEFANHERFPDAYEIICDSFESAIKRLCIRPKDYVCVLTRGHRWDEECVRSILNGENMPYYFGMIGSRRRVSGLLKNLREDGYPDELLHQLHAPIGLDIGGVTPAEIALSICAEMVQMRSKRISQSDASALRQTNTDMDMLSYAANSSEPRAMLLVLSSDGSTPVKSGSLMVVNALGKGRGTIGGGCSEAAAVNKARRLIGSGESKIIDFDMSAEVAAENGLVCGGRMTVLIDDIT